MENNKELTSKQIACFEVLEYFFGNSSQIEAINQQINSLFLEMLVCQEKKLVPQNVTEFCEAIHHLNNFFSHLKSSLK